jgi:hypothetical protein
VLVLDRLSALMLVLTSALAIAALTFSLARWHKSGPHFHTLFQFLLMGLNGAFLTGDLFNLFVFFEVLLAASYGLPCMDRAHAGQGGPALHRVNLAGASLFLIGVSLIYGVTGTLNMADLALRIPLVGRRQPHAAGSGRGHSRYRLPGQGRHVAAWLLAAYHLQRRGRTGGGDLCHAEQGRHLHPAAPVAAPVWHRRGRICRVR